MIICYGVIFTIFEIIPDFSVATSVIPSSVLGGATMIVFALIMVEGVFMVCKAVDMSKIGNMLAMGISVSVGLMFNGQTERLS